MNRTTRAMARLGTLAVLAGTVLGTPFAIGTANAATLTVTSTPGNTVTAATAAAKGDAVAPVTHATVTPGAASVAGTTETVTVTGSAYFPAGGVGYTGSGATVTCTSPCGALPVDDNVPEAAAVSVSDGTLDTPVVGNVKFNGLSYAPSSSSNCPENDYDTTTNCVTQGQVNTQIPIVVHYAAGESGGSDADGANKQLVVTVTNPGDVAANQPVIVGANPATPNTITCTTDASGNCTVNVLDAFTTHTSDATVAGFTGSDVITSAISAAQATPYPPIGTIDGTGHATAGRQEALNITPGSVAPVRLDLVSAQLIAPSSQDTAGGGTQTFAMPGDAVQAIYLVTGGCTPASPNVNCTGTPLSNATLNLAVDDGFFTPNCSTTATNDPTKLTFNVYGSCSFTTAPAAGVAVGNLKPLGTDGKTATVTTNPSGKFVVTLGIGRDSKFDNTGTVVSHVTAGSLTSTIPGQRTVACTATNVDNVVAPTTTAATAADNGGCAADIQWVTNQQPLNGGTAKLIVVPPLSSPNNISIDKENNFTASDSGTSNVPDVDRVVYEAQFTDQFGNLVSYAAGSAKPTLTKTGQGHVGQCAGSTSTDACAGAFKNAFETFAAQADGTQTETDSAVIGTYLNLPVTAAGPQVRYQADVLSQAGAPYNDGFSTATPGVNDGTQTDVLSWAPPTSTFKQVIAGIATYQTGTGTASTDTLTLNFYNQLAQPVVTFTVAPGSTVPTATAVTVTAKLIDNFGNPIVGTPPPPGSSAAGGGIGVIQVVRSGANESSCTPIQNGANQFIVTNTSGIAGYTFSCDAAGVSNVSMVVTGPGGTQLAQGREAITFTGAAIGGGQTREKPTLGITAPRRHVLVLHAVTHPGLVHVSVHFYKVVHGLHILVGAARTGRAGHAHLRLTGLRSGTHHRYAAKVVGLSNKYRSVLSRSHSHVVR